ncbi:MAG: hypothetical protein Q7R98_03775 [Candidatus Jorgensenbacteria bacterium]|nr:hypothetical protein [Candidatus Jorgensenbacteria bacterium]
MSPTIDEVFGFLSGVHRIVCGERLTLGNIVDTVFHATDGEKALVVKIGLSERAAEEVRLNQKGYDALRGIGATRLLPDPLFSIEYAGVPIVVMEDCGLDFYHAVQIARDPVILYSQLVETMNSIYHETRCVSSENLYLNSLRLRLEKEYDVRFRDRVDRALVHKLHDYDFRRFKLPFICFSSFDFTPEDVFVSAQRVRYVDPLPEVLGIPAVDLACFAGVALDAYGLPGAKEGYKLLADFAVRELPKILSMNEEESCRLFCLGRALQCALSARFRLISNPQKAGDLIRKSVTFLKDFLLV